MMTTGREKETIVCIGDSLVEGYPFGTMDSWVQLASQKRRDQGHCERWLNCGISGETTGEVRDRFERDVLTKKPKIVYISAGTNDFLFLAGSRSVAEHGFFNLKEMARQALAAGIYPILITPPCVVPRMAQQRWEDEIDYELVNVKLKKLRSLIIQWVDENVSISKKVACLDFYKESERWCSFGNESLYFIDGLHPSKKGYCRMADLVCEKFPHMIL